MSEVEQQEMFSGPLDLSDADTSGFDPIPAATYKVAIVNATPVKTGPNGKMPEGTPQLNVQFKVIEHEQYENRRVFNRYTPAPPAGYDSDASKRMKGMFVRFLTAAGYEEEAIMSGSFSLDPDDLVDRELYATVSVTKGTEQYPPQNRVTGVKSLAEGAAVAGATSGLL